MFTLHDPVICLYWNVTERESSGECYHVTVLTFVIRHSRPHSPSSQLCPVWSITMLNVGVWNSDNNNNNNNVRWEFWDTEPSPCSSSVWGTYNCRHEIFSIHLKYFHIWWNISSLSSICLLLLPSQRGSRLHKIVKETVSRELSQVQCSHLSLVQI